jgi:hypothetical protein
VNETPGNIHWLRVLIAIVLGEVLPLVILYLLVALYGVVANSPSLPSADAFAQSAGLWVGPIAGSIIAYIVSLWAGSETPAYAVPQALIIGLAIAAIDPGILVAMDVQMRPLDFASNAAKFFAAVFGGISASRGRFT